MVRIPLLAVAALLGGCATTPAPGTSPGDMSAAQHLEHADRHDAATDAHAQVALNLAAPAAVASEPLAPGSRLWRANTAGGVHQAQAGRHAEHARQHAAAAEALGRAEEASCREAPAAARTACPLEAGVAAIDSIEGGVRIHLLPEASPEAALAGIRCHLARASTLGHEGMAGCPLYARGLVVKAFAGQRHVDVIATDAAAAAALQRSILESMP